MTSLRVSLPVFQTPCTENQQFWTQQRLSRYINYILHRTRRRCLWKAFISISLLIIQNFYIQCKFKRRFFVSKKSLLFMNQKNRKNTKRNVNCIANFSLWRPWNLTIVCSTLFRKWHLQRWRELICINKHETPRCMFDLNLLCSLHQIAFDFCLIRMDFGCN